MKDALEQESHLNRNRVLSLVAIGCFLAGVLIGGAAVVLLQTRQAASGITAFRESDISNTTHSQYTFIDPLITIKGINNSSSYNDVKAQVASYIASQQVNGLFSASVDFRDINVPGGFTINGSQMYTPASLDKVPLMMAYYKLSETDPSILSQEITYPVGSTDADSIETIKSTEQLIPGTTYTIEQLIEHMIRYSDNNATDLLKDYLNNTNNAGAYTTVFSDLGIDPSTVNDYTDNMTVVQYSIFLRALYNATYLNWNDSEHALQLLSETDFSEGIESGVPNDALVAQKFGEVKLTDNSGNLVGRELNNCGIIYYPDHPYLLCIMTKATGDNIQALESELESISKIVYSGMQKLYPN